jgi:hypothetical protein
MRTWSIVGALALAVTGMASAQDVKVDYDKATSFASIKTFSLKVGTAWGNPLGEKRVASEVEEALAGKGWAKAEEGRADAQVVLHGATQMKHSLNTFYSGMGGYGWRGGAGMGTATTTAYEYTVGTLVVDIFDAKSKQLLWRGVAQDELKDDPEKRQKQIEKGTNKLFKDFPPGSKQK